MLDVGVGVNIEEKIEKLKLTQDQQKAFNRLKRALKDFEKAGGLIVGSNEFQYAMNGYNVYSHCDSYEQTPDKELSIKVDDANLDCVVILDPYCDASPWIILNEH